MNNFGKEQLNMTGFNPEDVSDPMGSDPSGYNPDAYNDGGLGGDISSLYLPDIPTTSAFDYTPGQPPPQQQGQPNSQPPPPQAPFQQDYQPQEGQQHYMYGINNNGYGQQDFTNMECAGYGTEMKTPIEEDNLSRCMMEIELSSIRTFQGYSKISDDVTLEEEMESKKISPQLLLFIYLFIYIRINERRR